MTAAKHNPIRKTRFTGNSFGNLDWGDKTIVGLADLMLPTGFRFRAGCSIFQFSRAPERGERWKAPVEEYFYAD
jgi:hypothetical protein